MAEGTKPIPPRPPAPTGVELNPILGGRLWIAVSILLGFGLIANPKFNDYVMTHLAPPDDLHTDFGQWKAGGVAKVRVTVITADSTRLACGQATVIDGAHCAFGGDRVEWPRTGEVMDDNRPDIIQPYRTSPENALILLVGLWAQPDVAMRLHREPPIGTPVKRLQRFDVTCNVKFLTRFDNVSLRWDVGSPWQTEHKTWVARPLSCTVN